MAFKIFLSERSQCPRWPTLLTSTCVLLFESSRNIFEFSTGSAQNGPNHTLRYATQLAHTKSNFYYYRYYYYTRARISASVYVWPPDWVILERKPQRIWIDGRLQRGEGAACNDAEGRTVLISGNEEALCLRIACVVTDSGAYRLTKK